MYRARVTTSLRGVTQMRQLNIQLQPTRSPGLDVSAAVAQLRGLATGAWVSAGEDDGPDIDIGFKADDPAGLWAAIREQFRMVPALAAAAIVVCQGERGWDDYLLLHHFDPSEPLDELA
jgi:hypothetical protein